MTNAHKITLTLALCLAALLIVVGYGYMQEHEGRIVIDAQQKADAAAAKVIQDQESKNTAQLAAVLATLANMKQTIQTPAQIVQALPQVIQVPMPIREVTPEQAKAADAAPELPDAPKLSAGDLIIPQADAKAFFDAQVDCKANVAKLSSCQQTVNNQIATMTLDRVEISQLTTALKGGTKWYRTKAFFKAAGIGAAVGAGTAAYFLQR